MDKTLVKRIVYGIGILVVVWFVFVQKGGDSVTILNQNPNEICEVYFAFNPEENGWGPNRINSGIRYPQSRDIHLPLYFEWFADSRAAGYSGRVVSCDGDILLEEDGLGIGTNYFIWKVL